MFVLLRPGQAEGGQAGGEGSLAPTVSDPQFFILSNPLQMCWLFWVCVLLSGCESVGDEGGWGVRGGLWQEGGGGVKTTRRGLLSTKTRPSPAKNLTSISISAHYPHRANASFSPKQGFISILPSKLPRKLFSDNHPHLKDFSTGIFLKTFSKMS